MTGPSKPLNVRVTDEQPPLDVNIINEDLIPKISDSKPPDTTAEQDRKSAGQRRVNATWEYTQAAIAISVTEITLIVAAILVLGQGSEIAFALMVGLANLVIGFYFGRTNHARIGDEPRTDQGRSTDHSARMDDR